jgi:hypothetical protein
LVDIGSKNKPFIIQFLVHRICSICSADLNLTFPFFKFFEKLLIYREPSQDDHSQSDEYLITDPSHDVYQKSIYGVTELSKVFGIDRFTSVQSVRVMVLLFLEHNCSTENIVFVQYVRDLILRLVKMNAHKSFIMLSATGSEKFGEKLRCWQALCVLVHYLEEGLDETIGDQVLLSLSQSCAHGIRVHIEIFCAALARRFPDILIPKLLKLLSKFNYSQQVFYSSLTTRRYSLSSRRYCPPILWYLAIWFISTCPRFRLSLTG